MVREIADKADMIIRGYAFNEVRRIQEFIREHYLEMYELWETDSTNGFYEKRISTQRKH